MVKIFFGRPISTGVFFLGGVGVLRCPLMDPEKALMGPGSKAAKSSKDLYSESLIFRLKHTLHKL